MEQTQIKSIAKKVICATLALFGILTLLFSLLTLNIYGVSYKDTGFSFISFDSTLITEMGKYQWLTAFLGICSIIELIAAIAMIFLAIYTFFKKDTDKFEKIIITVVLLISVLYMIEGIVYKNLVSKASGGEIDAFLKTASFVPLIINCILLASYIFVNILFANKNSSPQIEENKKNDDPFSVSNATEQLKQYKELFDMGIITQEEFEEKKKQLL